MDVLKVNILGTEYTIEGLKKEDDPKLEELSGYCDTSVKKIVYEIVEHNVMNKGDLEYQARAIIRHEIIHAFLFESGLDGSSLNGGVWALNEEMIDWFAIQSPKIFKAFQEVNCL